MSLEREQVIESGFSYCRSVLRSIDNKEGYIKDSILPRMEIRRARHPFNRLQVVSKLFDTRLEKPGEGVELMEEFFKHGFVFTPEVASEIADIVYYTRQENCPDIVSDPSPLFDFLGVTKDLAESFCIVKYESRLLFSSVSTNYKDIENAILERYVTHLKQNGKITFTGALKEG